jgi:hypothetical protein
MKCCELIKIILYYNGGFKMNMKSLLMAGGLVLTIGAEASADNVLPDPVWTGSVNTAYVGPPGNACCIGTQTAVTGAGTTTSPTFTSFYGASGFSQVVGSLSDPLAISASSAITIADSFGDNIGTTTIATLTYYVSVNGAANTLAPLNVVSHGSLFSTPGVNDAFSIINLSVNGTTIGALESVSGVSSVAGQSFGISAGFDPNGFVMQDTLQVGANQAIKVIMTVETAAGGNANDAVNSASAFLDPFFSTSADYTISVSPGVANVASGVPEPATWAMMILGFAGVGFMAYRRKQNGPKLRVA